MKLVVVTGLSGSGKSVALQALEDIRYYCVDNLPATLLADLVRRSQEHDDLDLIAVGVDSRNGAFLSMLTTQLDEITAAGVRPVLIFIDTDQAVLLRRYNESRRPHPLSDKNTSLQEAIELEREQLGWLRDRADIIIDTTELTPHELRRKMRGLVVSQNDNQINLQFESFGYRYGIPSDADIVFDARCLPNPHWDEQLRPFNGTEQPVIDFLSDKPLVEAMFSDIAEYVSKWLPRFVEENRSYLTVAIGCTGGKHRSVYLVERFGEYFRKAGQNCYIRHRELNSNHRKYG